MIDHFDQLYRCFLTQHTGAKQINNPLQRRRWTWVMSESIHLIFSVGHCYHSISVSFCFGKFQYILRVIKEHLALKISIIDLKYIIID